MGTFGQRLKELRNQRGISQNELSKHIGVSKSSVNMYERDEREPGFETLEAIADFFNVNMDYLLGRDVKQSPRDSFAELNNIVHKFDPTQLSASAMSTVIKIFSALSAPVSPEYEKNLQQATEEMRESFTLSDMQYFVAFTKELCDIFIEIDEEPCCTEHRPLPDSPRQQPEEEE